MRHSPAAGRSRGRLDVRRARRGCGIASALLERVSGRTIDTGEQSTGTGCSFGPGSNRRIGLLPALTSAPFAQQPGTPQPPGTPPRPPPDPTAPPPYEDPPRPIPRPDEPPDVVDDPTPNPRA